MAISNLMKQSSSPIKSVQRGVYNLNLPSNGGTQAFNVAISEIDPNKSFLIINTDIWGTGSSLYKFYYNGRITNPTTLVITASTSSNSSVEGAVAWEIIEFV